MQPRNDRFKDKWNISHVASWKETDRLGMAMLQQEAKIFQRHLFVLFAVHQYHGRARCTQPPLSQQRRSGPHLIHLGHRLLAEQVGPRLDEIKQVRVSIARALLPLRLKEGVNAAAPIDHGAQTFRFDMGQLGGPITAEAGADHRDSVRFDFAPLQHIVESGDMNLMGLGGCNHGTLTCPWAVEHQATPSFFDKPFREGVALFFPIVDATPVHDERRGIFLRQAEMADDLFAIEGNGNAFKRDIEIARCGEMHLAGFQVGVLFAGSAGKRVTAYAVIAVRLEISLFRFIALAVGFGRAGSFFPTCSQRVPDRGPSLTVHAVQPCKNFLGFLFVGMIERCSMAHSATNIAFDFFQGSWLVHGASYSHYGHWNFSFSYQNQTAKDTSHARSFPP